MQRRPRDDVRTEAELPPLPSLLLPLLPGVTEMLLTCWGSSLHLRNLISTADYKFSKHFELEIGETR